MLSLQGPKMVLEKLVKLTLSKTYEYILTFTEVHLPEKFDAKLIYSILVQINERVLKHTCTKKSSLVASFSPTYFVWLFFLISIVPVIVVDLSYCVM
jgi:hypothetical protein